MRPLRTYTLEEEGKRFLRKKAARAIFKPYSCTAHGVRQRDKNTEFSLSKIKLPPCYFSIFKWERFVAACAREALVLRCSVPKHDTKLLFMCSLQLQHLTFIKKVNSSFKREWAAVFWSNISLLHIKNVRTRVSTKSLSPFL
jgi:hypothetical protein